MLSLQGLTGREHTQREREQRRHTFAATSGVFGLRRRQRKQAQKMVAQRKLDA